MCPKDCIECTDPTICITCKGLTRVDGFGKCDCSNIDRGVGRVKILNKPTVPYITEYPLIIDFELEEESSCLEFEV